MLQAERFALERRAKRDLLAIKEKELQFYTTNFASFSTQSVLLVGFSVSAVTTLLITEYDVSNIYILKDCFYILNQY